MGAKMWEKLCAAEMLCMAFAMSERQLSTIPQLYLWGINIGNGLLYFYIEEIRSQHAEKGEENGKGEFYHLSPNLREKPEHNYAVFRMYLEPV